MTGGNNSARRSNQITTLNVDKNECLYACSAQDPFHVQAPQPESPNRIWMNLDFEDRKDQVVFDGKIVQNTTGTSKAISCFGMMMIDVSPVERDRHKRSSLCSSQPNLVTVAGARLSSGAINTRQRPAKPHSLRFIAVPATFQLCQFLTEDGHVDRNDWSPLILILTISHLAVSTPAIDAENELPRLR